MEKTKKRTFELQLGANIQSETETSFAVWAPHHTTLFLKFEGQKAIPMERDSRGFFRLTEMASAGDCYTYQLENGLLRPDPISRLLPKGVHGPTQIVDPSFNWHDGDWQSLPLEEMLFYELHVGAFSKRGSFEGVIDKLDYLLELGINTIELMPVAQFPGRWNWGYDGASLYAPCHTYGGVNGLKRLVDKCHQKGIAVCLDVVYNHFGPEGSYLAEFGPYFHDRYHTPWGKALNYDGPFSDIVRRFIIDNALYWVHEYHIDALRLDAIHGIYDFSSHEMLRELAEEVPCHIIAENDLNDCRFLRSKEQGGFEFAALWNDDFHHAAHSLLTGENHTYYSDFSGVESMARCLDRGLVYDGQYSEFRKRKQGNSAANLPLKQLISFTQNHDQIGNRPFGERLSALVSKERQKLAACLNILSPMTPMLFMGEEYAEPNPFEYFVDFESEKLMRSIFEGRKREFHQEEMPFPGKESFVNSQLSWEMDDTLLQTYKQLIAIRKRLPPLEVTIDDVQVEHEENWLSWSYPVEGGRLLVTLVFGVCSLEQRGEVIFSTQSLPKKWDFTKEIAIVQLVKQV